MSERADVVVLGGGIAGFSAALAAREAGAKVILVDAHVGASGLAGGAWDVAPLDVGVASLPGPTLQAAVRVFGDRHPHHPYGRAGARIRNELEAAHAAVLGALGAYRPLTWEGRGMIAPTDIGALRRVSTVLTDVAVVDERERTLRVGAVSRARRATVERALRDAMMRAEIGDRVTVDDAPRPEPITSFAGPQSDRVLDALSRALVKVGVERARGPALRIATGEPSSKDITVHLARGVVLETRAAIVATGKFLGGGVEFDGTTFRESLLRAPIFYEGRPLAAVASGAPDPIDLFGVSPFERKRGWCVGLGYDATYRVLGLHGEPVSPSVFAAGSVLEGVDASHDGTGFGVAALTGYFAGKASVAL